MAIAEAKLTPGQTFSSGDTVTDTTLTNAADPDVKLAPTGDETTGLSSPGAGILGVEISGTEVGRFVTGGLQMVGHLFRTVNNNVFKLNGGNAADTGGNIVLYGGAHATLADDAAIRADETLFTDQTGGTQYASISGSGLEVGATGTAIKAIWHTTKAISSGSLAADASGSTTVTVTGAAAGDAVFVGKVVTGYSAYIMVEGYVSAADTVTIVYFNHSASAKSIAMTVNVTVLDIT